MRRLARSLARALALTLSPTLALTALATPLLAAPGDSCVSGFEHGQELQKQGRLLKARAELKLCAGACPEMLAAECRAWLSEVERKVGRTHVEVRDAEGYVLGGAHIAIDGETAAGADIEVDPGPHTLAVEAPGFVPATRTVEVAAGATVPVAITLSPLPKASSETAAGPRKPAAIGLGAAGIASLLAGGALLVYGKVEEGHLAGTCKNMCSPAAVSAIERAWIAGGVVAGAGVLLGAAAVLLWPASPAVKAVSSRWQTWALAGGGGLTFTGELR